MLKLTKTINKQKQKQTKAKALQSQALIPASECLGSGEQSEETLHASLSIFLPAEVSQLSLRHCVPSAFSLQRLGVLQDPPRLCSLVIAGHSASFRGWASDQGGVVQA